MASARGLSELVKILCDLRLAALALLVVTEGLADAPLWTLLVAILVLPLSFLPVRWWDGVGQRMLSAPWYPVVDTVATVLVLVLFGVGSSALVYVGASLALLGAACRLRGVVLAVSAVVGLHVLAVVPLAHDGDQVAAEIGGMLGRLLLLCACALLGRRLSNLLTSRDALYRRVHASELSRAHAEERTRLAQEMHDSLSKTLHGLHLLATSLTRRLEQDSSSRAADARALMAASELARNDSRRLLADLRHAPEELTPALRDVAERWRAQHPDVVVDVRVAERDLDLGPGARYEVVRSVSELLENVARHADARRVRLSAGEDDGWVLVEVTDDGRGMPEPDLATLHTDGHYGLVGVHERMRRVNGTTEVSTAPGAGTTVRMRLPGALLERQDDDLAVAAGSEGA
ncbi:sensor histidine kinase [Angustibacter sp. McL0619]|uniref:sensor histidine kinase n=1 Tax=Angustibacter sp. McL0619 TaxID=3415676 RepID=UPI003CE71EBC